jgi:uncharacterized tellurite resistance protein B-like protein
MFDIVKQFLGKISAGQDAAPQTEHDLLVAVCALLVEIGRIDSAFSPEEMKTILDILRDKYGLSRDAANALIAEADKALETSVDMYQFARIINENYSMEKRIELLEMLWRIVFVDAKMDRFEHHLMDKLARLLRLTHEQLIAAKLKVLHPG